MAKESEAGKHCMSVKTFVDSNILIYAHDLDSGMRRPHVSERLKDLWQDRAECRRGMHECVRDID
jgi:hypothetical protein